MARLDMVRVTAGSEEPQDVLREGREEFRQTNVTGCVTRESVTHATSRQERVNEQATNRRVILAKHSPAI